jgi:hypothetical protein
MQAWVIFALPWRHQQFGAIVLDRQQLVLACQRGALRGVGLDQHRQSLLRQPGDVGHEGHGALAIGALGIGVFHIFL